MPNGKRSERPWNWIVVYEFDTFQDALDHAGVTREQAAENIENDTPLPDPIKLMSPPASPSMQNLADVFGVERATIKCWIDNALENMRDTSELGAIDRITLLPNEKIKKGTKMNKITIPVKLDSLKGQTTAELRAVESPTTKEQLPQEAIDYAQQYTENGITTVNALPANSFILPLHFVGNHGIPFVIYKMGNAAKFNSYRGRIGQEFAIIINSKDEEDNE